MSKPLFMVRAAAPVALALAAFVAPQAASAQYWSWGAPPGRVFGPPPVVYGEPDDGFAPGGAILAPRMVAQILNARGYRLVSAPQRRGPRLIAIGENSRGDRARFVIDAYDGALIRMARAEGGDFAPRPPAVIPGRPGDYAYGQPDDFGMEAPLGAPPRSVAPVHKPKPKPKTAARTVEPKPVTPAKPAPTEATRPPQAPTPAPAAEAPAPAAPPQTATAPTPQPQTPLAPDARPPENAKPVDIGPRVEPVARAPETAPAPQPAPAKPPEAPSAAAPVEPAAPMPDPTK
jgi:hypothetical protein